MSLLSFLPSFEQEEAIIDLEDLKNLTDLILSKYGYDFTNYAQSSLKRRVMFVMQKYGFKDFASLRRKVLSDPKFFEQFVLDITVNVTEMFRDPSVWLAIKAQVIPELAQKPEFNIWHAACSSGEEVLSMAILLDQAGILDKAKIYGTDIHSGLLKQAREACYPVKNLKTYEENYQQLKAPKPLSDYYKVEGNKVCFDKRLIANAVFRYHDLVTDPPFFKFDVVFCRNVMIYFNEQLQNKVFELLHASLFLGGFLILGAKESLIWCKIADKFEAVNDYERIYRKVRL